MQGLALTEPTTESGETEFGGWGLGGLQRRLNESGQFLSTLRLRPGGWARGRG